MNWSGWAKKLNLREFARITFVERKKLSCYTFRITGDRTMNEMPRKLSEGEFLQIRKIGNSVGVILPKELLARLNLKEGDKFYPVEQPDGSLRLSPFNPKHARTMEIAREIMHEYRDTFAALAK
jgi:putative addiction module antidote